MSPPIAVPLPSNANSPGYAYSKPIQHMDIYQSPPPPMTPNHDPSDLWSQNAVLVGRSTSVVPLNSHTSQFQQQNILRLSEQQQRSSDPSTPASSESTPSLSSTASTLHSVEGGYLGTSEGNYVFKSTVPLPVGGHPTSSSASLGSHTTPLGMATWTNSTGMEHVLYLSIMRGQGEIVAQRSQLFPFVPDGVPGSVFWTSLPPSFLPSILPSPIHPSSQATPTFLLLPFPCHWYFGIILPTE